MIKTMFAVTVCVVMLGCRRSPHKCEYSSVGYEGGVWRSFLWKEGSDGDARRALLDSVVKTDDFVRWALDNYSVVEFKTRVNANIYVDGIFRGKGSVVELLPARTYKIRVVVEEGGVPFEREMPIAPGRRVIDLEAGTTSGGFSTPSNTN